MSDRALMKYEDPGDSSLEEDFKSLVKQYEKDIGPKPPAWYKPERSMPKLSEVLDMAHSERSDHALRVLQSSIFESRLGMEFASVFDRDVDWVRVGEIEQWVSPLLRNEHDALVGFMESQIIQPRARSRALHLREEAESVEDYLTEFFDDWDDQSLLVGNGTRGSSMAYDATVHAMWSLYLAPDPGNERTGQRIRRVDPKIVYPIFEGDRGCGHVFIVAETQAKDMLGWYGDGGGPVTKRIKDMAAVGADRVNLHTEHELVYYANRTWEILTWGGELLRKRRHNMWRPPWVIIPFAWRQQMSSVSLGAGVSGSMWGEVMAPDATGILSLASARQRELARVHEPYLGSRLPLHDQMEKLASRLLTNVRMARNPPLVWQRPMQYGTKPRPQVENWEGGITEVPESAGGKPIEALPVLPLAEAMEPLMQFITTGLQAGVPLPLLQGASIGAQSSGSAIDVLMQTGWDKWVPAAKGIQGGYKIVAHTALKNVLEFGETMGDDAQGYIEVPRRIPDRYGFSDTHRLDAEMLERIGCYVEVNLTRFNINAMLQAATTLATIRTQIGVMSKREAIELLGYTTNVERSMRMRMDEDLEETPGILEAMTVEHLYEQLYAAYLTGDMESVRRIAIRGRRVSARQRLADLQLAAMGGGGDFVGQDQMATMQGGANATPFLPTGEIGNNVGTQGGNFGSVGNGGGGL